MESILSALCFISLSLAKQYVSPYLESGKMRFVELLYDYPPVPPLLPNEDYFTLPLRVASEMGLKAEVYTLRNPLHMQKKEIVGDFLVTRFSDPLSLIVNIALGDITLMHGHTFGWIPSTIAPLLHRRYIFTPHVYRLNVYDKKKVNLALWSIKRSRQVIVLTKFEASQFAHIVDRDRINVIPHAIDFEFFSGDNHEGDELRSELNIDEELILTVANLVPRKNIETLLFAFKIIKQDLPKSKLAIVGMEPPLTLSSLKMTKKGNYSFLLKRLARELKINKDVIFAGFQDPVGLRRFYAASNVFVLPSKMEGQLLAAGEAVVSGLPLVLSNLEPLREIYDDCALFHDPTDYLSLANHITAILTDEKLGRTLAYRGRLRMREYDFPVIKSKLKELYETLIDRS